MGAFGIIFAYVVVPLGVLISGILVVVYSVRLAQYKRDGKVLTYAKRGLIISLCVFVICLALLLAILIGF